MEEYSLPGWVLKDTKFKTSKKGSLSLSLVTCEPISLNMLHFEQIMDILAIQTPLFLPLHAFF